MSISLEGFPKTKAAKVLPLIPRTLSAISEYGPLTQPIQWPSRIRAMTPQEIREGKRTGHGHGLYYPPSGGAPAEVAINPRMPAFGIYLNLIHELGHHAYPAMTDQDINDKLVPWVWARMLGRPLRERDWRGYRGTP